MIAIATPFDEESLQFIINSNLCDAIKIASCDLTNHQLIKKAASARVPLILSTGMSYEREIVEASRLMHQLKVPHCFLHCNSTYPSPIQDINLSYLSRLKKITNTVVGYSSHDGNKVIPCAAVACGASIIEFHITSDKDQNGTDHLASINITDLDETIGSLLATYQALGSNKTRLPSQGELNNRLSLGKSYSLNKPLKKGDIITEDDLVLISPGTGLTSERKIELIGKALKTDKSDYCLLEKDDIQVQHATKNNDPYEKDLQRSIEIIEKKGYELGIPVRYHDICDFYKIHQWSMVEFHMSDMDLDLDPEEILKDLDCSDTKLIVRS